MGLNVADVSCVIFYSYPLEASLTSIFRCLEVCCCSRVYVLSSLRRGDEVRDLCSLLNELIDDVEFIPLPIVPDVENSPERISDVINVLRGCDFLRGSKLCFVASAGSRLEVVSLAVLINRSLTDVTYVSFLWGPWVGTYYPFTPKPIQLTHVIHPGIECFMECRELPKWLTKLRKLLSKYGSELPVLRREVLNNQLIINSGLSSKCLSYGGSINSCEGLVIKFRLGSEEVINYELRDYCSWGDVVKATEELSKLVSELCVNYGTNDPKCSLTTTLINASGIRLLIIDDYVGSKELSGWVGYALIDLMRGLSNSVIIDTNVVYAGIHNYLHEDPGIARKLVIPLSTFVEMYEHQVHVGSDIYSNVRAELSKLLINELNYFKPLTKGDVVVTPSEVGIATTKEYIAVTSDRKAFTSLYRWLGREAVLTKSEAVAKVRFRSNEWSRKVSYSYYALTQLKALSKLLKPTMNRFRASLDVITSK